MVSSEGLVLITGVNGYIGCRTAAAFLDAGYSVRGTVRSRKSADALVKALAEHYNGGLLEIVEVSDITVTGAFDSVLNGVTAIAHLAMPVSTSNTDVTEVYHTTIRGTLSIVESAIQHPGIKTFILMSSSGAVLTISEPRDYSAADWNDEMVNMVEEKGAEAGGFPIYLASKVKSERAFWKLVEERKPHFTITSLCPGFVAGPPLFLPPSPEQIMFTTEFIWQVFSGQEYPPGPAGYSQHTDVRDVARFQVFAVEHPETVDGQRILLVPANNSYGNPQAVADILRKAYPERRHIIKEGTPGQGYLPGCEAPPGVHTFGPDKVLEITGQKCITFEQMVLDAAKMFEAFL
ncbi:hypothetical protein BJ166DRAFT_564782 [Pestalotiopsis sp. NC0098]|nr:hypothetical protein BJ166DRAFT_564782 [Pestalotiopsis sp. NC0098]